MIRVTVELIPGGWEDSPGRNEIGRMEIANDGTGDEKTGNYDIDLFRRGSSTAIQRVGYVDNYPRKSASIWKLVKRALEVVALPTIPDISPSHSRGEGFRDWLDI